MGHSLFAELKRRNTTKVLVAVLALMTSSSVLHAAGAFDCGTKREGQAPFTATPRFTFSIERAPRPLQPTAFRVCDAVGAAPFLLVKSSSRNGKEDVRRIELSNVAHDRLLQGYADALSSNFKDEVLGLDGSSLCLVDAVADAHRHHPRLGVPASEVAMGAYNWDTS